MSSLKITTISNLAGTLTVPTDTVVKGTAKAWVNFDGTLANPSTTMVGFNVSSITDNGTGYWNINFSAPFVDNRYVLSGWASGTTAGWATVLSSYPGGVYTTNSVGIFCRNDGVAAVDPAIVCVSVFR